MELLWLNFKDVSFIFFKVVIKFTYGNKMFKHTHKKKS